MSLISLNNVSMSYEGRKVISNLSFKIDSGDYICIVGENGTGKTTLLKGLLSLKKVDSGSITFGDGLKKNDIGYLPQQTDVQKDFPASVREVVMSGCLTNGGFKLFYTKNDRKKAESAMEMLEISDIASKCYHELSGGQQQRVLLARAICATGKMLVMDEPVNGLDAGVAKDLYRTINKLNSEGITIVMISHDIRRAVENAKHIAHLGDNCLLFYGESTEYKKLTGSGKAGSGENE